MGGGKSKKGKIVAKRNDKASERGYAAGGAEEEEVECGERCDDMARAINYPKVGPFIDAKDQGKNRSGRERSEKEGTNRARKLHAIRNYFKSTTFGYVIIVAQSKTRWSMHILDYIKDVNGRASTQTNTIL